MPTLHYTNNAFLKQHISWSHRLKNESKGMSIHHDISLEWMPMKPCNTRKAVTEMSSKIDFGLQGNKKNQGECTDRLSIAMYESNKTLKHLSGSATLSNLQRKNNQLILVKLDTTEKEYLAYELHNCEHPHETGIHVWVEWLSTGMKQCINRHEIVKYGLRARNQQQPIRFSNNDLQWA